MPPPPRTSLQAENHIRWPLPIVLGMADDDVIELHLVPDDANVDGAVDGWITGNLPQPSSIYYLVSRRIGRHEDGGARYVHGQWWETDCHTTVLRYLPLGPTHGRCFVKYDHQYHEDVFYRSHGVDPASLNWPVRAGDASIHWRVSFFCEGTNPEIEDGSVGSWIPPDQLNLANP